MLNNFSLNLSPANSRLLKNIFEVANIDIPEAILKNAEHDLLTIDTFNNFPFNIESRFLNLIQSIKDFKGRLLVLDSGLMYSRMCSAAWVWSVNQFPLIIFCKKEYVLNWKILLNKIWPEKRVVIDFDEPNLNENLGSEIILTSVQNFMESGYLIHKRPRQLIFESFENLHPALEIYQSLFIIDFGKVIDKSKSMAELIETIDTRYGIMSDIINQYLFINKFDYRTKQYLAERGYKNNKVQFMKVLGVDLNLIDDFFEKKTNND